MLRLQYPQGLPVGIFPADPTVTFQPGMIAGLRQLGSDIFLTVSDGMTIQPFGIIDDIRTQAFTKPSVDEEVLFLDLIVDSYGETTRAELQLLNHPHIIRSSFSSSVAVVLNPINGAITLQIGTPLNFDNDNDGVLDSVRVICTYTYEVAGIPGDDSTIGSNNMTVWITRGIYATDQFDTTVAYPLNGILYCSTTGQLTTRPNGPGIAMVTGPPSANIDEMEFLWF